MLVEPQNGNESSVRGDSPSMRPQATTPDFNLPASFLSSPVAKVRVPTKVAFFPAFPPRTSVPIVGKAR